MAKRVKYAEPADYIPKELRKKFGLGEFADVKPDTKTDTKKAPEKKTGTKKK